MDPQYAQQFGVNLDELLVSQPDTGEQALEIASCSFRPARSTSSPIDSVAALTPKAESKARWATATLESRRAHEPGSAHGSPAAQLHRHISLFTNQLREKIVVMFGSPETTPGGKALKFYSPVRIDIRRIQTLKEAARQFGNRVGVKIVENNAAPPFKQGEFDIIYGSGISWEATVLEAWIHRRQARTSASTEAARGRGARTPLPSCASIPRSPRRS